MKKALIFGTRIAQIADAEFLVHPDLKWVDVPDSTTTQDTFVSGAVIKAPPPLPQPAPQPTLEDVIAVLPAPQKTALDTRMAAKAGK